MVSPGYVSPFAGMFQMNSYLFTCYLFNYTNVTLEKVPNTSNFTAGEDIVHFLVCKLVFGEDKIHNCSRFYTEKEMFYILHDFGGTGNMKPDADTQVVTK